MQNSELKLYKIVVIVPSGKGSDALKAAKDAGVNGGTIMLARGTYRNKVLEFLGLNYTRKEMIWMITQEQTVKPAIQAIVKKLRLDRKGRGIVFTQPVGTLYGVKQQIFINDKMEETGMYKSIYTIVDKGRGTEVVEAAQAAGAAGGTIINGRGSGSHETSKVFNIQIEPEKEIVMILVPNEIGGKVIDSIRAKLEIDEIGKGIIFTQPVIHAVGLVD